MKGKESDLHLTANLEQAKFQTSKEISKNYKTYDFTQLHDVDITGTPIIAKEVDKHLLVTFSKPAHSLVIGTTGSGKTTTFVSPVIQILSETKTKPSLFISDPKGELLADHQAALKEKGYEVKVLDLRNPYSSVRWNPLERPFLMYQESLHLDDEVKEDEERGCFLFDGNEYWSIEEKDSAVQVKKQQLIDEAYEDLNDISTAICPVTNKNEPMWESGAKNLILAILLAMLEDSADPENGMTKEKFNFYSLMKVATSTDNDCKDLLDYFKGRSPLSRATSLSKQVMDASDKTRGSYLSSCFDKLSIFSDMSLCALTSSNEIEFSSMGEKPIALFLQIPDEKETRHTLASLVVLQAYKELVRKANSYSNLTLPKPVYFILDEFGNLPKIHKLEQMITVGRSRNIWMNLVVQSYSQLAKVYDEKSADIIKSNCNIQVFIGTTDLKTIEDFSKRCGNYSIVQRSVGFNSAKGEDINSNQTIKERPLIYPSELQTLNKPGNMGHAIVTVFGYQPIKSTFTPCFLCPQYSMERSKQQYRAGRYFDEQKAFYDLHIRNAHVLNQTSTNKGGKGITRELVSGKLRKTVFIDQLKNLVIKGLNEVVDDEDINDVLEQIELHRFDKVMMAMTKAKQMANPYSQKQQLQAMDEAIKMLGDELEISPSSR
jgi:type IV secretion system protein VirD4